MGYHVTPNGAQDVNVPELGFQHFGWNSVASYSVSIDAASSGPSGTGSNLLPIKSKTIPIANLSVPEFKLVKPITVEIHVQDDEIIASNDNLELVVAADSEEEALLDFVERVVEDYVALKNTPDGELTRRALSLKQTFMKLIREETANGPGQQR